jgi:hypothetical protein
MLLELWKRISDRGLSSTGTGTSTSTGLLQVPRINSISQCSSCVYFTVTRSQLTAAVHCLSVALLVVWSSVPVTFKQYVLSPDKCHMNTFDWLFNNDNTNSFIYTAVYTMMMVTVKWSKHVALFITFFQYSSGFILHCCNYGCMFCTLLFNFAIMYFYCYVYVFLLLCFVFLLLCYVFFC